MYIFMYISMYIFMNINIFHIFYVYIRYVLARTACTARTKRKGRRLPVPMAWAKPIPWAATGQHVANGTDGTPGPGTSALDQ